MKKLLLLLSVLTISCSNDSDEVPKRDITVFQTTTFISNGYEVEKVYTTMGVTTKRMETQMNVIKFKANGNIECFQVDEYNDIYAGTRSTTGNYQLDFPKVYNILAVHIFDETQVTIQTGAKMQFTAGGLTYKATLENFN